MPARIRTGSTGDRKGRLYGGSGCGRVVFVGAHPRVASLGLRPIHLQPLPYGSQENLPKLGRGGPWASRQNTHRGRWLGKPRRVRKPQQNQILHTQGPVARKKTQASTPDFARRNHGSTNQEGVPRKKGAGESGPMDLGGAQRSRSPLAASPGAFWLLCRHGQSNSPPTGGETSLRNWERLDGR